MNAASPELLRRPQTKAPISSMLYRAARSSNLGKPYAASKANCACGGSCPACKAKSDGLKVSQPNDAAEIEADQIADKVMRMSLAETNQSATKLIPNASPSTLSSRTEGTDSTVHRKCDACEDEDEKILRKALPSSGEIPSQSPTHVKNAINSGGRPLDLQTRSFFEPRLGYDLGSVRVHTGGTAAESAHAINAKAYTLGNNIVFGSGEYKPESESGKHLLAHELAHAVQQGTGILPMMIHRTTVGAVLNEFFSVFSSPTLWNMPASDNYTQIVRTWQPVIDAVGDVKADLRANCSNWSANHITDPSWTSGMTSPPVADPNAFNIDVPHPPGTDPDTCRNAFIIYYATSGSLLPAYQTFELYTCSIGSFDIYATVNNIDCAAQTAQINIWMYNRMSRTSFGQFASNPLFALSGMESQYMWWNWTESVGWGPPPAAPRGGSGAPGGWNSSPSIRGSGACFTGGMEVTLADGRTKPISKIAVGDRVIAHDNLEQSLCLCEVVAFHEHPAGKYLKIWLEGGRLLEVTGNHALYVGNQWVQAGDLHVGDHLCLMGNGDTSLTYVSVDRIEHSADLLPLFDLTVADCHTYFVNGLLVHNKNA